MMIQVDVVISGVVQGVFYRLSTKDQADAIGVVGWVKNCSNGTVEASFQGTEDQVRQMLLWCHTGPSGARVDSVQELYRGDCTNRMESFTILK